MGLGSARDLIWDNIDRQYRAGGVRGDVRGGAIGRLRRGIAGAGAGAGVGLLITIFGGAGPPTPGLAAPAAISVGVRRAPIAALPF